MTTVAELRERLSEARADAATHGRAEPPIAFVPTMGALHDGHLALVRRAKQLGGSVVVSIFVNPLQFGAGEDLDRYPRTLEADLSALDAEGVDHVFVPSVEEMYPAGAPTTRVTAGPVGSLFEGAARPGHFDGMLTVVAKLVNIVQPTVALFGQKDAQQVFLVRRMVADLNLPLRVEAVPTVREADGLALSSRNRYLGANERRAARTLSLALEAAESAADGGVDRAVAAGQSAIMGETLAKLDYLVVVDPASFQPVGDDFRGTALVIVAAVVGGTRLIDNAAIQLT
ncbi:pantoate--beta-alanine ligase [Compostimonas suwonensis]|uniref:pantoate--beta-alanine ligase n=1 Tax=Compostimonas suwonensis TaxID=1048394 RepID=UPI000C2426FA|nr:pantoate--beta-alanine ligase [Compostimonas suwonensis]